MYNFGVLCMATTVTIKKWGNSLGIILPEGLAKEKNLKVKDKIVISVVKEVNLVPLFGSLKRKMTGQSFKDLVRKGW